MADEHTDDRVTDQPRSDDATSGSAFGELLALLGLVASLNPLPAVRSTLSQAQRGAEELIGTVARFNATMDELTAMAARVNRLLDDAEPAIRAALPQVTRSLHAVDTLAEQMGSAVGTLSELAARLGPLSQMLDAAGGMFGLSAKRP